jgi:hypothetical protein
LHADASEGSWQRPSAKQQDSEAKKKCGVSWGWEKKPIRVTPNRSASLYAPPLGRANRT